jgi:hypothetical protein
MTELEINIKTPTTMAGVRAKTLRIDKLAWQLAALYKGRYNGNVSVENGYIRATILFSNEKQSQLAADNMKKWLNSNPRVSDYTSAIKYRIT